MTMNAADKSNTQSPMTRRDFLKTTSAAVAGVSALGGLSLERGAFAAGSDTLKLALIGCGRRGSGAADQALNTEGPFELVAVDEPFKDRLEGSVNTLAGEDKNKGDARAERPVD